MHGIGGLLGELVPGLEAGAKKGLQYDVDFMKMLAAAVRHGNMEELKALGGVAGEFIKEVADETGNVSQAALDLLMRGGDPFAGSRHLLQQAEARFGKP